MKKYFVLHLFLIAINVTVNAQFGGLPQWPIVTASPNYLQPGTLPVYTPHQLIDWATPTIEKIIPNTTPTSGPDNWATTQAGYDDCGSLAFYVLHNGVASDNNALEVYRPDGTLLLGRNTNPAAPNGNRADDEMQIVKRPGFSNQWYLIYNRQHADGYACVNVLYSLFEINGNNASYVETNGIIQKDIELRAPAVGSTTNNDPSARFYIHAKAVSRTSKTIGTAGHDLYLHRRYESGPPSPVLNATFSIDRFEISQQGIFWTANSGIVNSYRDNLLAVGSPMELSPNENRLAVMARTANANVETIYVFDLNSPTLNNRPDVIRLSNLLIEPDPINTRITGYNPTPGRLDLYRTARDLGSDTSYLRFLKNYDRKISHCEFSWDGRYLYTTNGGYVERNYGNLTYLSQIDLDRVGPNGNHPVRIQIETVLNATGQDDWDSNTGKQNSVWIVVENNTSDPNSRTNFLNYHGLHSIQSCINGNLYFTKQHENQLFVIPNPNSPLPVNLVPKKIDLSTPNNPNITTLKGFPFYTPDQIDGFNYLRSDYIKVHIPLMYQVSASGCKLSCGTLNFSVRDKSGNTIASSTIDECPDVLTICLAKNQSYDLVGTNGVVFTNAIVNGSLNIPNNKNVFDFTTDVVDPTACCPTLKGLKADHITIYSQNTTLSNDVTWDHKIYIDDNVTVTIDKGATLDITTVDVIFGQCAKLLFKDGATIRATNSVFRPCDINGTWSGVIFNQTNLPAKGVINECIFKNAGNAINIYSQIPQKETDIRITNNLFSNCAVGIYVFNIKLNKGITGNTFKVDEDAPSSTNCYSNSFTGISASSTLFNTNISQNDFINNRENKSFVGINTNNVEKAEISSNHFTNNNPAITSGYSKNIDIENNDFETNKFFEKVEAQISTGYLTVSRIINNRFYNSSRNNKLSPSRIPAISMYYGSILNIKQNNISNFETGIQTKGIDNSNISENNIKDCWYFGISNENPKNVDVACNVINMEPFGDRNSIGISTINSLYSNLPAWEWNKIRGNCIYETSTAIHVEDQSISGGSTSPEIINNYLYNYSKFGLNLKRVNATRALGTGLTQQNASKNTFISNNIPNGAIDIFADPSVNTVVYGSYGISTISGNITLVGTGLFNSTASCGSQIGTVNSGIFDDEICDRLEGNEGNYPQVVFPENQSVNERFNYEKIEPSETEIIEIKNLDEVYATIYPNPAKDDIIINVSSPNSDETSINFYSSQGLLVKQEKMVGQNLSQKIDISNLTPGLYVIEILSNKTVLEQLKLVVE